VKCKVIKKAWCPLKKGYIMPGEIIEIPEKFIKGYAPYVQVIETTKKEPERTTKKESVEAKREEPIEVEGKEPAESDQELKVKETTKKSGDE